FLFMILALLPSVVAWYSDRTESKGTFKTVLACNLAGTLPTLTPMFRASIDMQPFDVAGMGAEASVWPIIYSAGAVGWGLVFLCRFIARFIVILNYEYRIAAMERMQRKLVEEWGPQIRQAGGEQIPTV